MAFNKAIWDQLKNTTASDLIRALSAHQIGSHTINSRYAISSPQASSPSSPTPLVVMPGPDRASSVFAFPLFVKAKDTGFPVKPGMTERGKRHPASLLFALVAAPSHGATSRRLRAWLRPGPAFLFGGEDCLSALRLRSATLRTNGREA